MNTPMTYHGTWWFPTEGLISPNRKHCKTLTGTLTYYGDKASVLELYFTPQDYEGVISTTHQPEVLFGETADGCRISLFNARWVSQQGWSSVVYEVEYIVEGVHLLSIEDGIISRVDITYPSLAKWCYKSRIDNKILPNQDIVLTLDMHSRDYLFETTLEDGVRLHTIPHIRCNWEKRNISHYTITEDTICCISFASPKGVRESLGYILKFSMFLSLAIYARQFPTSVELRLEDGSNAKLLFHIKESNTPLSINLIKYNELSEKIPSMLAKWYKVYTELSPIAKLLFRSGYDDKYDTSDFVGLAQGLDGFFKRFVNKLDGKDTQKYKDGIEKLIKRLQDVDVVTDCNIDAQQLKDSRDKYTHLLPEGENPNALEGDELLWLTHKCRVLLTCCILDCLGLTNEEINICCKGSAIEYIAHKIPTL
jgi:hypothetical protein